MASNVLWLCVVAFNINLKLTMTLDRAITQTPCYALRFMCLKTDKPQLCVNMPINSIAHNDRLYRQ